MQPRAFDRVVFFDPACPRPYSVQTLSEEALGGTEATVVRVAEALGARVVQHNRVEAEGRYLPPGQMNDVEHVVLVRDSRRLDKVHSLYPNARIYLWMHDLVRPGSKRGRRLEAAREVLAEFGVTIICVSEFQRAGIEAVLTRFPNREGIRTRMIYNPIDDGLVPSESRVDPTSLVFFSSPNKGLAYTLDAFRALRRRMPEMRLRVGNPGYVRKQFGTIEGVEWLGPLPHRRILAEVRTALCVFYPNFVLPETFGLVLAEANAVGTPVLTHGVGAAMEVLNDSRQTLAVGSRQRAYETIAGRVHTRLRGGIGKVGDRLGVFDPYVETILQWRAAGGRPVTKPDARFRLSVVAAQWRQMFGEAE